MAPGKGKNGDGSRRDAKRDEAESKARMPNQATTQQPRAVGAGLLILLQASSRLLTLVMAQVQVRLAAAEAFGAAHIHLELLLGVILMFSREGVRNALARQPLDVRNQDGRTKARERAISNVALLPIPIGVVMTTVVMTVYSGYLAPSTLVNHFHFGKACTAFAMGALLELLAEPLYTRFMRRVQLGPRVAAEGLGLLAKSISTLAMMILLQRSATTTSASRLAASSLLPFAIGQLCFGLTYFLVFSFNALKADGLASIASTYRPTKSAEQAAWFDTESMRLTVSMTRQNIVKHVLGEADKFAVTRLATLSEQGAYALASNYASLVARLLYQPLEESARLTFATTIGASSDDEQGKDTASDKTVRAPAAAKAANLLQSLLAFYALLSCYLIAFCPPFTKPLLYIMAGKTWALETSAPKILAVYGAVYLPVMAFNGLLEGFLQASASSRQLARYDSVLMAASAVFVACLYSSHALSDIGTFWSMAPEVSLVVASSLSTAVRATYCFVFARSFLSRSVDASSENTQPLAIRTILPRASFLQVLAAVIGVLYYRLRQMPATLWQPKWGGHEHNTLICGVSFAILLSAQLISSEMKTIKAALTAIRG